MHVVVTGVAGFIGSHTVEALIARGHRVTGIDVFDDYLYPSEVKRRTAAGLVARLPADRFALHQLDVGEAERLRPLIGDDVDVVCHLAALAGVRPSIAEPLRYVRANLHATTALLEVMARGRCRRLVFASSSSVYGARGAGSDLAAVAAFREDDPCLAPASPYAATKRAGELLTSTYRDLYGIGAACLRFFTVYGPRQRPDMAIHRFVRAIASDQPLAFFGDGTTRRDYTFIDDIVAGTIASIERVEPGQHVVYNLGGTSTVSLTELVAVIERVVGKPARLDRQPLPPGDVPVTYADITNAARDLGYRPTTAIDEGVARFWRWWQVEASGS